MTAGRYTVGMKIWINPSRQRMRCVCVRAALLASVVLTGTMGGCAKTLLSPREPRSQYSRYDLVRNQYAPQYIEDEFGRRIPNLRGRLLEKE